METKNNFFNSDMAFRLAFDHAPIGMSLTALDGTMMMVNESFCNILGYSHDELEGRKFTEFTLPEEVSVNIEWIEKLLKEEINKFTQEKKYVHKNKSLVTASITTTIVRNEAGEPLHFISQIIDISYLKKADELLAFSEKQWQTTFDAINDAICIISPEGKVVIANREFCVFTGRSHEAIVGQYCWELVHKLKQPTDECPVVRMKKSFRRESLVMPHNDKWINIIADPIFDNNNNIIGAIHIISDITHVRNSENANRESESRFRSLVGNIEDGIAIIENKKVVFANKRILEIFEISESEIGNFNGFDFVAPSDKERVRQFHKEAVSTYLLQYEIEYWILTKNGNEKYIHNRYINDDGNSDRNRRYIFTTELTKSKIDEIALRKSEEKYRNTIELAVDGIFLGDENGNFIEANSKACELTGYSRDELIGKNIKELFSEKVLDEIPLRYDLLMKGEIITNERIITRKDKSKIPIEMRSRRMPYGTYQAFMTDISARKKAEKEMRESEARYRSIFENTGTATVIIEENTIISLANSEFEKLSGYTKEEIEGIKSWTEFVDKVYLEQMKTSHNKRRDNPDNVSKRYEFRFVNKEGQKKEILLSIDMISGTKKSVASLLDITERKIAEIELKESEIRYRNLVESFHDMVFITDYSHRMIYANPSLERQTGYTIYDFIAVEDNIRFVHPDDIDNVFKFIYAFMKSNEKYSENIESRFYNKDGVMSWHSTVISKVEFRGKPALQFICHDITSQKNYEHDLQEAKAKAEESDRLKSAFLANMSHEIRTPMNAIIGFSNLLGESHLSQVQKDEFIQIIQNSGNQLLTIINDIIDFSKIEVGQLNVIEKPFDLSEMMKELFASYQSEVFTKGKDNIYLNHSGEFIGEKCIILSDEIRLKQVMANLLGNAVKFTKEGSIEFGCEIREKDNLVFYVKDTGIGIPEEMHNLIFEPFRQAGISSSHLYGGTGLGLSISKNLVELMHGWMWLESQPEKGSEFFFSIPYKPFSSECNNNEKKIPVKQNWQGLTILICEDDISNFMYLTELLSKTHADCIHADDGSKALELLQTNSSIDLILMDIRMPVMNGIETTKKIRESNNKIPIIAQTAYAFSEDKELCLSAGCNDCLSKPIKPDVFYQTLAKYLATS
ncbi:MAG: hypothetical protein A2275_04250 [Bacteroidetes bacterium RIFOXYA12_FULL_35_11]|nr:MAG: hypothetical protein A2X01_10390 [Bacteroidetes bacterium GWF2_35_48]OFY81027.1 MAG: hypothetical protein A2275_04250 [Bacteroidetes bacterium RIFOXYA12_FULL_35_11]OFY92207.1 MAG: hypothetical protein A2309_06050 [Bacteroidetes bacterium RIFOXYB2_FULL_35_7]OFZ03328.1 MAG: hypothetical protein A2491_18330 [Bacteroidetes bacterium RIFOXYC12_FULL_35_7]HBX49943.1 hypothetical protein [Bacteroidales bacterium]